MKTCVCSRFFGLVLLAGVILATTVAAEISAYTDYYLEDHCSSSRSADRYRARTEAQSISFRLKSPMQEKLDERGCRAGLSFSTLNETYGFLVTPVSIDIPRGPTNSCVNFIWFDGLAEDELNGKRLCGDSFPKSSAIRTKGDRFTIWWSSEPSRDADRQASFNRSTHDLAAHSAVPAPRNARVGVTRGAAQGRLFWKLRGITPHTSRSSTFVISRIYTKRLALGQGSLEGFEGSL
ncbi:hypothetical protein HPB52_020743 [Rhipicephalus sanguineus]|uniref:Uncharacterized protein n=1 Tax=Rhipicephalus sanguineus TaxID=34632 RepID=A0A9D4SZ30_RHISA|nr:hypothetical protein HPB52_020743 [Rhipicephalus sanguineus]